MGTSDVDIGRNIQRARYITGLSQDELAQLVGLDRSAVSRIERGIRRLAAVELAVFAEALHADIAQLLRPGRDKTAPHVEAGKMLFRAGPVSVDDHPQLRWLAELATLLASCAPERQVSPLPARIRALPPRQAGELAARHLRRYLGLGPSEPIGTLSGIAYRLGGHVVAARLPARSRLSGCILAQPGAPPVILVNTSHPPARQRFTLAHELGHHLLDPTMSANACEAGVTRPGPRVLSELRADSFASAFLLPKRAVTEVASSAPLRLDELAAMERLFGISHAATIAWLRALGTITETEAQVLRRLGPADGGSERRPLFRAIGVTTAVLLRRAGIDPGGEDQVCKVLPDTEVVP